MNLDYDYNLLDYGKSHSGDVVTKEGEVIGSWSLSEDGNRPIDFIPNGHDEPLFTKVFVGQLIQKIKEWQKDR